MRMEEAFCLAGGRYLLSDKNVFEKGNFLGNTNAFETYF